MYLTCANSARPYLQARLQSILESTTQEKLMFDCRGQSDALWHQFQVKLAGVLGLQLLEVLYRRE